MKTPCYVICNCNVANINVAAIYLSERLNSNLYFTLEKSIFSLVYISFCPPFFCQSEEKFVKCSHEREEGKFSDSQIFLFYKIYKSSQRMLLAFGFLLLFSIVRALQNSKNFSHLFVVYQELAQSVQWSGHDSTVLLFWLLQRQFWAYSCSLLLHILVWKFKCQELAQSQWKGNHDGVSLRCFAFVSVEFGENLGLP